MSKSTRRWASIFCIHSCNDGKICQPFFLCLSIFSLANSQQFRVVEFRKKFFSLTQKMEVIIMLKRWKKITTLLHKMKYFLRDSFIVYNFIVRRRGSLMELIFLTRSNQGSKFLFFWEVEPIYNPPLPSLLLQLRASFKPTYMYVYSMIIDLSSCFWSKSVQKTLLYDPCCCCRCDSLSLRRDAPVEEGHACEKWDRKKCRLLRCYAEKIQPFNNFDVSPIRQQQRMWKF